MNEFCVGLFIGVVQTVVGHPLDTIKIYKQNNLKPIYTLKFLYNGVVIPLLFNGLSNSIMFGMYCNLKSQTGMSTEVSAFFAGGLSSIFLTPHDYVKTQLQITQTPKIRNMYNGFYMTTLRESLGSLIYFTGYEQCMRVLPENKFTSFFAGGISGVASWVLIYPIDVVKTRIMSGTSRTLTSAIKKGYLWAGLSPCISRAFLVNGVSFYIYNKLIEDPK